MSPILFGHDRIATKQQTYGSTVNLHIKRGGGRKAYDFLVGMTFGNKHSSFFVQIVQKRFKGCVVIILTKQGIHATALIQGEFATCFIAHGHCRDGRCNHDNSSQFDYLSDSLIIVGFINKMRLIVYLGGNFYLQRVNHCRTVASKIIIDKSDVRFRETLDVLPIIWLKQ